MNTPEPSDRFFDRPDDTTAPVVPTAPRRRERRPRFSPLRAALAILTITATVAVALLIWGPKRAGAASDGFTYFPSASVTDGRHLVIAGNLNTLSGSTVTVSFSVPSTATTFALGVFDGNANSAWDQVGAGGALDTTFTVFADPQGNGSGTTQVAAFGSGAMAADAWSDYSVNNTQTALAPSGRCFYYVRASTTVATRQSYNTFKVRVSGTTYITPLNTFGFMGAYNAGITTPLTYDGSFTFYVEVPQGKSEFDLWDGDADRADDSNDPNTPDSGIPTWSVTVANPESAAAGAPADDYTGLPRLRAPSVYYNVVMPDGSTYTNNNPSGTTEWELYRLGVSAAASPTPDVTVAAIPAGLWHVDFVGLDAQNTVALRFDSPVLGVDASGTIVRPEYPYRLGDLVWFDTNRNGTRDSGEASITTGVVLTLRDGAGSFITTAAANASGYYSFTTLPGTFTIDVADPSNYTSGGPLAGLMATTAKTRSVVVTSTNNFTLDFGFARGPALVVDKVRAASSPSTAAVGDVTTYTVTVRNVGETTATSVVVTDTIIGADMIYVAGSTVATWVGGSSNSDPTSPTVSTLRWSLPSSNIASGGVLTLSYRVRVKPGATWGAHPDTATVGANDASGTPVAPNGSTWIAADTDPDDTDGASVWVTVPELSITKARASVDASIQAGQPATFTIVVRNAGDSRIATVPVTDTFPSGNLNYTTASPAPSSTAAGLLTWNNVGPLNSGQQTTITVGFTAAASPTGTVAVDTAASGATVDVNGRAVPADSATASVAITRPQLTVNKWRSSPDPAIQIGESTTFTVVVSNNGDTRIDAISLSDLYQNAYLALVTATPPPALLTATTTVYATNTSDTAGTWSGDASSLGATDSVSATSSNPPFEMWQWFTFPAGIESIDGATITVRSRGYAGFGTTYSVSAAATATEDPGANPTMVRGTIDAGTYANLAVSDNTYLTLREPGTGAQNLAASFTNMTTFTDAADTAVDRIVVTVEGDLENGNEAAYVRFWNYGTGAWSTTWYQLGSTNWTTTEATYTATVTNTTEIQNYLNATGNFQVQFADNDYRAGTDDNTRTRFYLDYMRVAFGYTGTTTVTRDDTWAIQYSTSAGPPWSDVTAATTTVESTLTAHSKVLTGLLTSLNPADFLVRILGSVVGSADATGIVTWDTSRLDLTYKALPSDGTLSWTSVGPLDPGQQTTVTMSFIASAAPAGQVTVDTATVPATTDANGDPVASSVSSATVAITAPGVAITKTLAPSQPATAGIGAPVNFRVLVTNTGNTTITAASIVDTWSPTYLSYASAVPAATSVGSGVATWTNLTPIAPGKVATLTITYTTVAAGLARNRAYTTSVTDNYGDTLPNVAASATIDIADTRVSVTKTRVTSATVVVGEVTTYTVVVKNTGLTTLATVPVTDFFIDADLDFVSASRVPSSTTASSLTWNNLGTLTPGQQTTVTVRFIATAPTSGRSSVDTATVAGATDLSGVVAGTVNATDGVTVRWSAVITALSASDAPTTNTTVSVTSSVRNDLAIPITNSTLTYVIWWDDDTSGTFNAGDTWIDSAGIPHTWDGVTPVTSHVTSGVNVAGGGTWTEPTPWLVTNTNFPYQGNYNVTETWREQNGTFIDVKTTQFYSIPALGWPLYGLTLLVGTAFMWLRRPEYAPLLVRLRGGAK